MSYHCSQALVEDFSGQGFLDGEQCAALSGCRTAERLFFDVKKKGSSKSFPSMETSVASMASRGVEKWISSLPDSLASRSQLLAGGREKETRGICGPKLSVSFARLDPPIASSKTSPDSSPLGSVSASAASPIQKYRNYIQKDGTAKDGRTQNQRTAQSSPQGHVPIVEREWVMPQLNLFTTSERYCETWRKAGMMLNGVCYLQPNAELPIGEVGSGLWLTPHGEEKNPGPKGGHLTSQVKNIWQTPNTMDGMDPKSQEALEHEYEHRPGRLNPNNLRDQVAVKDGVRNWPTPKTGSNRNSRQAITDKKGGGTHKSDLSLEQAAEVVEGVLPREIKDPSELPPQWEKLWRTPHASDGEGGVMKMHKDKDGHYKLRDHVQEINREMWPTPAKTDYKGAGKAGTARDRLDYATESGETKSKKYPTPRQSDYKGAVTATDTTARRVETGEANLAEAIVEKERQIYPTPRANKVHPEITDENREKLTSRHKANLEEDIAGRCGKATGQLNPDWVEWLMGWPIGWTSLEPLDGEHFQAWMQMQMDGTWWFVDPADEEAIPRVSVSVKHRVERLKGIGNGQVSICVAVVTSLLGESLEERDRA